MKAFVGQTVLLWPRPMKSKIANHVLENSFKGKQLALTVEAPASNAQQSVLFQVNNLTGSTMFHWQKLTN